VGIEGVRRLCMHSFRCGDREIESGVLTNLQSGPSPAGLFRMSRHEGRHGWVFLGRAGAAQDYYTPTSKHNGSHVLRNHLRRSGRTYFLINSPFPHLVFHSPLVLSTVVRIITNPSSPDDGQCVSNVESSKSLIIYHDSDDICLHSDLILLPHLTYAVNATQAASFAASQAGH
jgi:hypothetical protein